MIYYKISHFKFNVIIFSVEEKKEKTMKNLLVAKEKISTEITDLRDKIKLAKDTIAKFKEDINRAQSEQNVDVSGMSWRSKRV